jgi:hypothetical protein
MHIEEALRDYLKKYPGLAALVGDRVYRDHLPEQSVYPAVSFFAVSSPRHHQVDIAWPRYQFDCWGKSPGETAAVAEQIRHALQRYKGVMEGVPVIQGVFENEIDLGRDPDEPVYHRTVDIKIIYEGV